MDSIIVAVLALLGTLGGSWLSNDKIAALMDYRLQQLENKVEKHNQVIERTFKLEERTEIQEVEIKHAYDRIDKLEQECGK